LVSTSSILRSFLTWKAYSQQCALKRGEFQLTSALERLRKDEGFHGLVIDGVRFDIGLPDYYLDTLQNFRKTQL
jgi:UTP-glucose-1-phosphate uridylyltransferase